MLWLRGSHVRPITTSTFAFICLCVFMQMLGTTMTLWDLDVEMDQANAPLLEGLSLPATFADVPRSSATSLLAHSTETLRHVLRDYILFRPPISFA
jgi:hypothetical protein